MTLRHLLDCLEGSHHLDHRRLCYLSLKRMKRSETVVFDSSFSPSSSWRVCVFRCAVSEWTNGGHDAQ